MPKGLLLIEWCLILIIIITTVVNQIINIIININLIFLIIILLYNNYFSISNIASGFYDCNIGILLPY